MGIHEPEIRQIVTGERVNKGDPIMNERKSQPAKALRFEGLGRYWPYLLVVLGFFPIAVAFSRMIAAPSDDAYIFMTYAKNFIEGNGLTFNGEVVQGFSSTLWVALLVLFGYSGVPMPVLAETLSLFSGLFALIATYALAKSLKIEPKWMTLLPVALLVASGDFVFYMSSGLEEVLFTALMTLCAAVVYSQPPEKLLHPGNLTFPLLMALMVLARPEGAMIAGLLLLILAIRNRSPWLSVLCGLKMTLMLAPVFSATRLYYGYWLPNTWYAKGNAGLSNLNHGAGYFFDALWRYAGLIAAWVGFTGYLVWKKNLAVLGKISTLLVISIIWFTYILTQGGDNMVGGRVLIPVLPLVYVALVKIMSEIRIPADTAVYVVILIITFLVTGYLTDQWVTEQRGNWHNAYRLRKASAMYLVENFPDTTVVAVSAAGVIPYYTGMTTIDTLGLNNVHIAHEGKRDYKLRYGHQVGDGEYVLSREPDVIFLLDWTGTWAWVRDREIIDDPEFIENYTLLELPGMRPMYIRNDS